MTVTRLTRTLEQEVLALERGASLECLVCGEFVLLKAGLVHCPECRATMSPEAVSSRAQLQLRLQAG
jgi:Zn finger protein HypA/HybF involved in hydrogenase expression